MNRTNKILPAAIVVFALTAAELFAQSAAGAGASPLWGNFQKKISVQRGLAVSAWEDRGDVSMEQYGVFAVTMTPVGDGTHQIKFDLIPGADYNFAFFAVSTTPMSGITPGAVYYDAVPSFGGDAAFVTSTSPVTPLASNTVSGGYTSIGGDARRYVTIPDMAPGGTFYVFCNWASTPTAPVDFRARPADSKVHLSWGAPYGWWGSGSEQFKAIDVIAGGSYVIYRSSISAAGPYEIAASTPGNCFSWTDASVENGRTYYYAISSSDAYRGALAGVLGDVGLESGVDSSKKIEMVPGAAVPIRFRVEGINWDVIVEKNYLAWLTPVHPPSGADPREILIPPGRIPSRIVAVKVGKTFGDRMRDILGFVGVKI